MPWSKVGNTKMFDELNVKQGKEERVRCIEIISYVKKN